MYNHLATTVTYLCQYWRQDHIPDEIFVDGQTLAHSRNIFMSIQTYFLTSLSPRSLLQFIYPIPANIWPNMETMEILLDQEGLVYDSVDVVVFQEDPAS